MPQSKTETIKKLRTRLAEQDEVVRKLSVLADALLAANPSLAKALDREETLRRMLDIYDEEAARMNTVGGALMKALESSPGPFTATVGEDGVAFRSGAGTWAPQLSVEKARAEDEAKEVRLAANRLALGGADNLGLLKAREARKSREARRQGQ